MHGTLGIQTSKWRERIPKLQMSTGVALKKKDVCPKKVQQ